MSERAEDRGSRVGIINSKEIEARKGTGLM